MNWLTLVGSLESISKISNSETRITLAVQRSYENNDGVYVFDYIPVKLLGKVAEATYEYCKQGDLIAVKGRVEKLSKEEELEIVAEKITFLSQKKEEK